MKRMCLLVVILCLVIPNTSQAGLDVTVFSCDFENGIPSEISGPGVITDTQGFNSYGFGLYFLRNGSGGPSGQAGTPTVLTLAGLPAHTSISILVDVAFLDSWDGSGPDFSPDYFNIHIDGRALFCETISNSESHSESFQPTAGDVITLPTLDLFTGNINYDSAYIFDSYLDDIEHTSSQLSIEWFANGGGWQGGTDESWAIDNINIILHDVEPIPAPGAIFLGIMGVSFTGWLKRRKSL